MYLSPDSRIYCLLQSLEAHPLLADAVAPPGLLAPSEQTRYDRFVVAKRRRDWLLGRWTAKHLVQSYLTLTAGSLLPLDQIEILADDDGAPYVRTVERLPISLSISHSGRDSFCAVCPGGVGAVGADVELIEARDDSFARMFFTEQENRVANALPPPERDALITALWSAKEAVLKTFRVGLRADTRQLEIHLRALDVEWHPVQVVVEPILLPSLSSVVIAWHQLRGSRILSLALLQS